MRRISALLAVVVLTVAACGGNDTDGSQAAPTSLGAAPAPTTVPTAGTTAPATTAPATTITPVSTTTDPAAPSTTSTVTTTPTAATTTTTSAATTTVAEPLEGLVLATQTVFTGLANPVLLTAPRGDNRLFIVEQQGRILVSDGGAPEVFLDIRDRVTAGGERGLLGLAFHPHYFENRRFFVDYTGGGGTTFVSEFVTDPVDPGRADPATERVLLSVDQPARNHNGGMVEFGPDGNLYIGLGDGGGAGDRFGQGQRPDTLLGTILRIDVDQGDPYAIPTANPFVEGGDGAPEVWAYGLRNPWRFSFDGEQIFIADVGQGRWEEVDIVTIGAFRPNLGWPITEGFECFQDDDCDAAGLVEPAYVYAHENGRCSITGGYVYRGTAIADLRGAYLFGDFCTGEVIGFRIDGEGVYEVKDWSNELRTPLITSFGRDGFGELYLISQNGTITKILPG